MTVGRSLLNDSHLQSMSAQCMTRYVIHRAMRMCAYSNYIGHNGGATRAQRHAQARVSTLHQKAAERAMQRHQQRPNNLTIKDHVTLHEKTPMPTNRDRCGAAAAAARRRPHAAATPLP